MSAARQIEGLDRVRAALACIPADNRDTWVRCGMAVKAALGDDGFSIWDEWSQSSELYRENDARAVWKSVRPDGGITIATLFGIAREHGWHDEAKRARVNGHAPRAASKTGTSANAERHAKARKVAARVCKAAHEVGDAHPYLIRKGVAPTATLREINADELQKIIGYAPKSDGVPLSGRVLVVPVCVGGELSTIEFIDEAGRKSALAGGRKSGGYWIAQELPVGDGSGLTLLVGEGVVTVLSAATATGHVGVAALSCGNLLAVTRAMHERYPSARVIVLADLGNGQRHAEDAARTTGALLAVPKHANGQGSDFNDMHAAQGIEAVRAQIEAAAQVALEPADDSRRRFPRIYFDAMSDTPSGKDLIKGVLPCGGVGTIYGASGSGKTFVTVDMAARVATGLAWRGRRVRPGLVVYVAAEGGARLARRFRAWRDKFLGEAHDQRVPLVILTRAANLLDAKDTAALMVELREIVAEFGMPLALLVFDTLSRSIPGGDENSPRDMTAVIGAADSIRAEFGASVLLVHHCGKDAAKGMRGHSALFGACDAVLAVADGVITLEKSRDGADGETFGFRLDRVALGTDEDGDEISTCVCVATDAPAAATPRGRALSGVGKVALSALREAADEKGTIAGGSSTIPKGVRIVRVDNWRARFGLRYGEDKSGDTARKAFTRGKDALLAAGCVGISDPFAWVTR